MKSVTAADRSLPLTALLWCGVGMLAPQATLLGELFPFGLGLAACPGATLPTMLCLAIGYLLAHPVTGTLRYVATVALIGGLRWVLAAVPGGGRRWLVPPALAFVGCAGAGVLLLGEAGAPAYALLTVLAEGVVAAGAALVFHTAHVAMGSPKSAISPSGHAALCLSGTIVVMALSALKVGEVTPGHVVAGWLVLMAARSGQEMSGGVVGGILGAGLALMAPGQAPLAVALVGGGLLAGVFSRFGRWLQAGALLLWTGLTAAVDPSPLMLTALMECGVACLLFALIPRRWDQWLSQALFPHRDRPAVDGARRHARLRLETACGAIDEVGRSVEEVSKRLLRYGSPDLAGLYRGCADTVCGGCPLRGLCWDTHTDDMLAGLEQLTPTLQQTGQVTPDQLQGYPADHCRNKSRLTTHLSRGYQQWLAQESAWTRLEEIQQAVNLQFSGTGSLLRGLCRQLEDAGQVEVELSQQIAALCQDEGLVEVDTLATRDDAGRLTVELLLETPPPSGHWQTKVARLCGCSFSPAIETAWGNRMRLTLTEAPRYRVEWGQAQQICPAEKLCGDSLQVCRTPQGVLAVLADGMGSGGRAAVDSTMAAGIATRLWGAGFSPEGVVQTVNAALLVKSREESLSTLDVAMIDPYTGRLDSYKAGAAVTLLKSGGRVSRLERPGLPVGILPQVQFEHSQDRLAPGDILLMVSDGALCAGVTPLELLLQEFPEEGDLNELAQAVVDAARATEQHPDDISALVLRLAHAE